MDGQVDGVASSSTEATGDPELRGRVLGELLALRRAKGLLTPQKLAKYPALVDVMGAGDLLDAFFALRRELRRYVERANRNEAAAALSILAREERVLDRLQVVADKLSEGEARDQRTARRWSNLGMPALADDLTYLAEIQGWLGRELLGIRLDYSPEAGLMVAIEQMVLATLPSCRPELSLWVMDSEGDPQQLKVDLNAHPATEAVQGEYRMTTQWMCLTPDLLANVTVRHGLTLAVTGRDAPMRVLSFAGPMPEVPGCKIAVSVHRARVAVEIAWSTSRSARASLVAM
ncbi:hypothetical protein [Nostocoides vanveenii]|uniref:Uncharacterized protein n=1 Tax=Nostocoides vanveenii TaxID=330835 RepID=A0ABN2KPC0_9MICO